MTTLLHVNSSPRGEHSDSLKIAKLFLEAYRKHQPDTTIDTLDLFDGPLPPFGRPAAEAKIAHLTGRPTTADEDAEWAGARKTFERFAAADLYLFDIPMWNNGIPYMCARRMEGLSHRSMTTPSPRPAQRCASHRFGAIPSSGQLATTPHSFRPRAG